MYYVAWYKDGMLIYSEDLASSTTLMSPSIGTVSSNFVDSQSILTIESVTIGDSGNYTCAVSCAAKRIEFDMIDDGLKSTSSVVIYGKESYCNYICILFCVCKTRI